MPSRTAPIGLQPESKAQADFLFVRGLRKTPAMAHSTPEGPAGSASRPGHPPFRIRVAGASDYAHVARWLPEALIGTPAATLRIAADAATADVAGVAALRIFSDRVGRFLIHVDPPYRRRGCGTALLEAVRETALRAGVQSLLTTRSYEVGANDAVSTADRAFWHARGLAVAQEIRRYRADLTRALAVLEPMYQRFMRRTTHAWAVTMVPAAQVDANRLAAFAARHVGGVPEDIAQRLRGVGSNAYSPTLSWVALIGNQIVGALLSVPAQLLVETKAVDERYRGGGLNLALMYHAAAAGAAAGYGTIEFEHDTRESDTAKLARRLGATPVGCRQCFGVALPANDRGAPTPDTIGRTPLEVRPPDVEPRQPAAPPLRAVHTPNFPELLRQLGVSLLLTTSQAGKLVLVREEGDHLNVHVRSFATPRGMALSGDRLAIATKMQVWEFVNVPAAAARLEPPGRHDACYLPRSSHFTGDIRIPEMAWDAGGDLWVVNTRFSCLCTLDRSASFTPRWRPPFVSALEPSDRCHLNGLAMVEGTPKYATALGETNTGAGWRPNQARGGIVIDVASGAVLARGLSMPHSPRWYLDRLWVCESGAGTFGVLDPSSGRYAPLVETSGFTRGVDFSGPFAFVGLSQVRATALSSGIGITERLAAHERMCGIGVIDLRSGQVVALLRFEAGVQEIFAVTVLGRRFPDLINDEETLLESSFVVPTECLDDVSPPVRGAGQA